MIRNHLHWDTDTRDAQRAEMSIAKPLPIWGIGSTAPFPSLPVPATQDQQGVA